MKEEGALLHSPCRFELLASTASDLLQARKPQEAVEAICRRVMAHLDCHIFFNFLADEKAGKLHLNASAGIPEEEARRIEWLDYGVAACGRAARDGCRVVVEHIPSTPDEHTELVKPYGIKACAAHPLKGPGGKIIGTLLFGTRSRETFSEEDLLLMNAVTDQVAMAMARMKDEETLRRTAKELETLLESVPALVWIAHDQEGRHITGNQAANEFLRIPEGEEVSLTASPDRRPTHYKLVLDGRVLSGDELPLQRAARGEVVSGFECDIVFDDGTVRRLVANATPLFDSHGMPRGAIGAYVDLTGSKRMEEALKASLSEKENLLRELSHRTKNNMQVISGLLNLQATRSNDDKMANVLGEAQNRIQAMALVHEKLYKGGSIDSLSIKEYAEDLANNLLKAHQGCKGPVKLVLELEDIKLPHDVVLPGGLILNELISNSLKHAFPNGKSGTIFISLRKPGEKLELRYQDDGPGLPNDIDLSRIETLGLKLVHSLAVHQLRGSIELAHHSGTEFVFRFPLRTIKSHSSSPMSH